MNLSELKKLAEAATPGPWNNRELKNMEDCILGPDGETWVVFNDECAAMKQEDSDFVTAANPQTILQLLAVMEQMADVISKCIDYQDACTCDGYAEHTVHMPSGKSMDWTQMRKTLAAFNKLNSEE